MSRQKNTATRAANSRGGNDKARGALNVNYMIHETPPKGKTQSRQAQTELADLRRRYNAAILGKRWAEAARLQRAYHAAERRRRAELLRQVEVGRG